MNQPLNTVVIGAGYFSQFHLDSWQRMPGARLSAVVEPDDTNRQRLTAQLPDTACVASIEQALSIVDADIVDIVTPPATHQSLVEQVATLTVEKTLLVCQKPFCTSIDEARSLAASMQQLERKLVVHENFRFQPWYEKIKTMIDDDALGDVLRATFWMRPGDGRGKRAYLDRQPYFQKMPRFLIRETGIHWIDTFRYIFGEPQKLYADLQRINPHIAGEDAGTFTFHYAAGLRVTLDANRHLDHVAKNKRFTMGDMLIEGTDATLRLNGDGEFFLRQFGDMDEHPVEFSYNDAGFAGDSVFRLNQHVVSHLTDGTPLHNEATSYLRNLELEALVYESADSGMTLSC